MEYYLELKFGMGYIENRVDEDMFLKVVNEVSKQYQIKKIDVELVYQDKIETNYFIEKDSICLFLGSSVRDV